ncbi:MAG: beta-lactamase family protein [Herpetosiphonaceae bacterium]|nr:beta-lactamase family protein [Herpetosiphonaceae bacterium]
MLNLEIDTLIRTQVSAVGPGVAVAVIKADELIHCQGYGLANLEWNLPVTPQTFFGLGSLTKPFTATAIMLLEKQGKLHLADSIQTYLPDYPATRHKVTLRHLLTHTSGIPNFVTLPDFWQRYAAADQSVDELIAVFKNLPLEFDPGTRYSYSNSGYMLLGRILERLVEMSYCDTIRQLVFAPLSMTHSTCLDPQSIIPYRTSGYTPTDAGYQHARFITANVMYAAGGLGSTLDDMVLWHAALRDGRLLDHPAQERMYTPTQMTDGHTENYGLGWAFGRYRQHRAIWHAGGVPGYSAFFGRFPDDDIALIILSNHAGFDGAGLARQIIHLLLDLLPLRHPAVVLAPSIFDHMLGTYHSVFGAVEVRAEDGTLLYLSDGETHPLTPISETGFRWIEDEDVEVHFEMGNDQGDYERIRVIWPFFWLTAERVAS